jgi:hypothetical protein
MLKPYQAGDRVAIYTSSRAHWITVTAVDFMGWVLGVEDGSEWVIGPFNPLDCRRLDGDAAVRCLRES